MAVLNDEEIEQRLADLEGWHRDGDSLVREFTFDDFQASVEFVNRITPAAEEMNHHPDLCISWNKVRLSLTNHSAGGLTDADFTVAERFDSL